MDWQPVTPGGLDENVMIRVLYFETQIDRKGPEWCAKHLIGAMRRKAASDKFKNIRLITDAKGRTFEEVRMSTARRLATFCSLCGKCELSKILPE